VRVTKRVRGGYTEGPRNSGNIARLKRIKGGVRYLPSGSTITGEGGKMVRAMPTKDPHSQNLFGHRTWVHDQVGGWGGGLKGT